MKINRAYGERRAISDTVEETRTIEFVISTDKKDRHGTRLMVDRWDLDNFNRNGIVGYQHDVYGSWFGDDDPDKVIGVGKAWIEEGKLIGSVNFEPADINPLAEKLFRKVIHGTLKSTSVGFRETSEGEEIKEADGTRTYVYGGQELLEFSIVNIPSNTDALKRTLSDEQKEQLKEILKEIQAEEKPQEKDINFTEEQKLQIKIIEQEQIALEQAIN